MTSTVSCSSESPRSLPNSIGGAWTTPTANWFGVIPIPLTLFALAAVAVSTLDVPLAHARLHGVLPGPIVALLERIETFGHGVGTIVILIAVWMLDPARRRCMPRLIACSLGAGLAANIIKLLVARRRPWAWLDQTGGSLPSQFVEWFPLGLNTSMEQSFPSSHTAAAVGLALGLTALYPRGRALFLTTAVLVAAQRAVFCAHFLSDVLAGAGVAWIVVLSLFRVSWINRFFRRFERRSAAEHEPFRISRAA